ncbi:Sec1-like protein [Polychytrium aggregatum]|uniref:Sec1-like protein n=1 Tax=Polychytrium aggregatum TaxID=110093 RepID=UPI0022FE0851|nr:Sec1-like protein [Polychytrium aggregatum]KAI9199556.1 Sec1-like protein [Polychytrium aggregatum]
MDVIKSVQGYLNKMIQDVSGMKVLLLDGETTPIISMVVTQSQLLAREIFLIDRVDNRQKEKMKHLKCITFVRPTPESIQALVEELRDPCYGEYYLYFSNSLKKSAIERLAEVDEYEVVREVQEYYADFLAVNPDLFSLGLAPPAYSLYFENGTSWETKTFQRSTEGLVAILLALKKKPLIRYAKSSVLAKKLATEVMYQIQQEGPLFDFRRPDTAPILLILDRRQDPVTPLLSQWTYQALVHELLGITNGRVSLGDSPDRRPEMKEIVLNIEQDPFYKKCVFMNMGDLGGQIKEYVDEYQNKHKSSMNVESIADMKRFIDEYPEFKKLSGNVTKHVSLVSELSRLIERNSLLEVSELEQSLAVQENHSQDVKTLQKLIERPNVPVELKVRLVMLYALRYEKAANSMSGLLVEMLKKQGASEDQVLVASSIIQYAGSDQRQDDIFSNTDVFARTKQVFKGLKGIENVYTQHTPYLVETIESVIKGKTKEGAYPFVDGGTRDKPQDIIVFIVGGATYAEAREVSKINASNPGIRIVLGGTTIHNSSR